MHKKQDFDNDVLVTWRGLFWASFSTLRFASLTEWRVDQSRPYYHTICVLLVKRNVNFHG